MSQRRGTAIHCRRRMFLRSPKSGEGNLIGGISARRKESSRRVQQKTTGEGAGSKRVCDRHIRKKKIYVTKTRGGEVWWRKGRGVSGGTGGGGVIYSSWAQIVKKNTAGWCSKCGQIEAKIRKECGYEREYNGKERDRTSRGK